MKKIWANCVVKNEENFIWFSIMSIVDWVDKVLIYDTGSRDKTVEIIKKIQDIKKNKIIFKEVGEVDKYQFTRFRQKMLDNSKSDWILILDGDEVWWEKSIKLLVDTINTKGDVIDTVAVPFYNAIGDIYHYLSEKASRYEILGRKGNLTIRAISTKIKGLHVGGPYGSEGYLDENNIPIQKRDSKRIVFIDAPFLHLTHLKRSSLDSHRKFKYELGVPFPKNFAYPEVFYKEGPQTVQGLFKKRSKIYTIISLLVAPCINLKRK